MSSWRYMHERKGEERKGKERKGKERRENEERASFSSRKTRGDSQPPLPLPLSPSFRPSCRIAAACHDSEQSRLFLSLSPSLSFSLDWCEWKLTSVAASHPARITAAVLRRSIQRILSRIFLSRDPDGPRSPGARPVCTRTNLTWKRNVKGARRCFNVSTFRVRWRREGSILVINVGDEREREPLEGEGRKKRSPGTTTRDTHHTDRWTARHWAARRSPATVDQTDPTGRHAASLRRARVQRHLPSTDRNHRQSVALLAHYKRRPIQTLIRYDIRNRVYSY